MEPKISFEVDLADLESVERRLPELEQIVADKRAEAQEAAREYSEWNSLLKRLRYLVRGESPGDIYKTPPGVKTNGGTTKATADLVVKMLEESGRPLRAAEINKRLSNVNRGTLGWILSTATNEGRIQRVAHGVYAPSGWKPSQPELMTSGEEEDALQD
jgi:hypothetical protein